MPIKIDDTLRAEIDVECADFIELIGSFLSLHSTKTEQETHEENSFKEIKELINSLLNSLISYEKKNKYLLLKEEDLENIPTYIDLFTKLKTTESNQDNGGTVDDAGLLPDVEKNLVQQIQDNKAIINEAIKLAVTITHENAIQNLAATKIQKLHRKKAKIAEVVEVEKKEVVEVEKKEAEEIVETEEEIEKKKKEKIISGFEEAVAEVDQVKFSRFELNRRFFADKEDKEEIIINSENLNKIFFPKEDGGYGLNKQKLCNSSFRGITLDFENVDPEVLGVFLENIDQANFFNCKIKNLDLTAIDEKYLKGLETAKFGGEKMEFESCNFGEFKFDRKNLAEVVTGVNDENITPDSSIKPRDMIPLRGLSRSNSSSSISSR